MKTFHCRTLAIAVLIIFAMLLLQRVKSLSISTPHFAITHSYSYASESNYSELFESQLIPQPAGVPAAHSSSFVTLSNGDLLAFWFAGTKEGRPDVQIWMSRYHNGVWSQAKSVVNPSMVSRANNRYVVKLGNPVAYVDAHNVLHLFVVSVSMGGWSGSNLNHMISNDEGATWSEPDRIVVSPFFNVSTLVRTSPVGLSDGGFYLPVYHEFIRKYPELLRFDASGNFVNVIRITNKNRMLQPSVVPNNSTDAVAYLRNSTLGDTPKNIFAVFTHNGGLSWDKPIATNLFNHDSSVVGLNLQDGRFMMIYNQVTRGHLWLAISNDGLNWRPFYQLENSDLPSAEFSYPDAHISGDTIDITYTYNRKEIKHVRFNKKWLNHEANNAGK